MSDLKLYRKRYIPFETVHLKDDILLHQDSSKMITKWDVFRPKALFDHGVSCYMLGEGFKISKFLNKNDEIVYYYCDIIDTEHIPEENTYIFHDLLVDVIVYPNGFVKVVDLAELADGLDEGIITEELVKMALRRLEKLLEIIYNGQFSDLTKWLEIENGEIDYG